LHVRGGRGHVISEKRFLRLVEMMPQFALQMMRVISQRLRRQGRD
jgi:CRP-like cAMP-binding protein